MAQWFSEQLRTGLTVYDLDGDKIGQVEDVPGTQAVGYLRVSTGFLGLGRELYVPFGAISNVSAEELYLNVDKDDLDRMGWDSPPATATGARDVQAAARRSTASGGTGSRTVEDKDRIKLHEEDLDVQKRRIQAGEVTVGKEVVTERKDIEVPVTREEVYIERRPVDRVATDADFIEDQETIRVPVMEEQVRVEKRPVVTEEVVVGKRVVQDTEHVADTVRREEVVVEREGATRIAGSEAQIPGGLRSWDEARPRFRSRWQQRYGQVGGRWEDYEPRYRYGYEMARDPRYRGRAWSDVEPALRSDYERRYSGSAWEQVKDAVHDAWDSVTDSDGR